MFRYARELVPDIDQVPTRKRENFPEIESRVFWDFYGRCIDYSLLHVTGFYNIYQSMVYIKRNNIPGSIVECGCFLGGAAAFMGLMCKELGLRDPRIWLFDTFEGPPVGSSDIVLGRPLDTPGKLPNYRRQVEERMNEIVGSGVDVRYVTGLVEDTVPREETGEIALLRLDTDFYTSTRVELQVLYPKVAPGGVVIVDDYGLFQGSRKATDEYFADHAHPPLFNRIDNGIWAGIKPGLIGGGAPQAGRRAPWPFDRLARRWKVG